MKVVSVEEMQHIEAGSDEADHSYSAMMEQAGRSLAEAIDARKHVPGLRVLILVGPGNNGGDGLVAGRYLSQKGAEVTCYLYKDRSPSDDENFRQILEGDARAVLAEDDEGWERLRSLTAETDVVIDALLGTGTRLPLRGKLAEMLRLVGTVVARRRRGRQDGLTSLIPSGMIEHPRGPWLVGVDGPTGLAYDTGELDEVVVPADLSVTFAYPKLGHFQAPGGRAVGELVVADIGIDPDLAEDVVLEVVTPTMVGEWLPSRPSDAHKGTFGKAMIVAGSVNYTGAAHLAGASATRAGAGLVTLALPGAIHTAVAAGLAEATYVLLPDAMGVVSPAGADVLLEALKGYDVLLIGPGLGRETETSDFLERVLGGHEGQRPMGFLRSEPTLSARSDLPPLIIDADGLNILSELENWPQRLPPDAVLTPHPGEMARLMNGSVAEVENDRIGVAGSRAREWGQVVVLKGAYTVVAAPDGRTVIEPFANPGLATAGTGDVLAGTITALRAQGLAGFEAAAAGVYLHGLAGEIARRKIGLAGMVAGDVLDRLPEALERIRSSTSRSSLQ